MGASIHFPRRCALATMIFAGFRPVWAKHWIDSNEQALISWFKNAAQVRL